MESRPLVWRPHVKTALRLAIAVALCAGTVTAQGKPVLVVHLFTVASDVTLPYDMKLLQTQAVAEFKVSLGKDFEVVNRGGSTRRQSPFGRARS